MIGPLASSILFIVALHTGMAAITTTMNKIHVKGAMQKRSHDTFKNPTSQSTIPVKPVITIANIEVYFKKTIPVAQEVSIRIKVNDNFKDVKVDAESLGKAIDQVSDRSRKPPRSWMRVAKESRSNAS